MKTIGRNASTFALAIAAFSLVMEAFPAAKANSPYPLVPLNISGIMNYQVGSGTNPLLKTTFTTKSIIALYNKSDSFLSAAGTNQIPAGSSIVWNPNATNAENSLFILNNSRGFFFSLDDGETNNFGSVQPGALIGVHKLSAKTSAGTETDLMSIVFSLDDANGQSLNLSAQNTVKWKYGAVGTNDFQKTTLSVSISGAGGDSTINGIPVVCTSITAKGNATGLTNSKKIPFLKQ